MPSTFVKVCGRCRRKVRFGKVYWNYYARKRHFKVGRRMGFKYMWCDCDVENS